MPGFLIANQNWDYKLIDYDDHNHLKGCMHVADYSIFRNTLAKFQDDKVFIETDCYTIITEGITLNRLELMRKANKGSFSDAIIVMKEKEQSGEPFFSRFRGSFSGAIYDKSAKEWTVWTNQTGESAVFYYAQEDKVLIGSSPDYILSALRKHGVHVTLDEQAVYSMLTFAYMYDDQTYAKEIRRLLPGHCIKVKHNQLTVEQYYDLPWGKYDLTSWPEERILDELDKRLVAAVSQEYDKDLEYGYRHLADMSGGFDCRMSAWIAKEQGYSGITCLHYSQFGSNEEAITRKIVNALDAELLFYPMDSHPFLFDGEKLVGMNYGLQLFVGITGGQRMLDAINTQAFGVEHTGMIGDIVIGSALKPGVDYSRKETVGAYSNKLMNFIDKSYLAKYRGNPEKQYLVVRGLLGALSSVYIRRNYTEIASPFMDVDVLEFCFSIPYEKRTNHELYKKWVLRHHPKAAEIRWSTDDTKMTDSKLAKMLRRAYYHGPKKLARMCGLKALGENAGMNPFEYWHATDRRVKKVWDKYISGIDLSYPKNVAELINSLYSGGGVLERSQAVTAALALRYWFPGGYPKVE